MSLMITVYEIRNLRREIERLSTLVKLKVMFQEDSRELMDLGFDGFVSEIMFTGKLEQLIALFIHLDAESKMTCHIRLQKINRNETKLFLFKKIQYSNNEEVIEEQFLMNTISLLKAFTQS